jgi:hypothetical protein
MIKLLQIGLFLIVGIALSCNSHVDKNVEENESLSTEVKNPNTYNSKEIIFHTNVENLRLRENYTLSSRVIGTLKKNTELVYLNEKSEQEDTVTVGGKSLIEFWYKVKVPKLNNEGWVFGGCLTEKSKTTKKLLSINDLKKEYKNLPNNCETIFQYIFPNSKVAQNIVNENHQLQLQNKEFNNYPFFEIITNIFNKTNDTQDHLYYPYRIKDISLLPIYKTPKGELKIMFGDFFLSDDVDKKWKNWFSQKETIGEEKDDFGDYKRKNFTKIETELSSKEYVINIITNKRTIPARLINYEEYSDECLTYSAIKLKGIKLKNNEYPLYGSFEKIEIDYQIPSELGKKFKIMMEKSCFDCGHNILDLKVVARIANTDIYLVANNIKEMEELNTHNRSIYYLTKEIGLGLQHEEIDYFGCPCL